MASRIATVEAYDDPDFEVQESDMLKQIQETAEDLYRKAFSSKLEAPENQTEELREDLSPTEYLRQKCFPFSYFELGKVFESYIKILDALQNLQQTLPKLQNQGREPEGTEEFLRVKRRASEFSARFSRNSIYPLRSQIRELSNILKTVKTHQRTSREALRKSLVATYQSTVQALQAYTSYMASPKNIQVPEKLEELVRLIKQLDETSKNLFVPIMEVQFGSGEGDIMAICCNQLLEMLKAQKGEPEPRKKSKKKKKPDLNEKKSQLSMYEGKLFTWKKKSETLARLRQQKTARKKKEMEEAKAAAEIDPTAARERKMEGRKDVVVSPDKDIETQVERYRLHDAKTQEDLRKSTATSPQPQGTAKDSPLRRILESALKELEAGSEEAALDRIKSINLMTPRNLQATQSNVQVLYVRSKTYDDEEDPMERPIRESEFGTSRTKYSPGNNEACDCENCLMIRRGETNSVEDQSEGLREDEEFEDDFESYSETDEEAITVKPMQPKTSHEVREEQLKKSKDSARQGTPPSKLDGKLTDVREVRRWKNEEQDIPNQFKISSRREDKHARQRVEERTRMLENNLVEGGTKKVTNVSPRNGESKEPAIKSRVGRNLKAAEKTLPFDGRSTNSFAKTDAIRMNSSRVMSKREGDPYKQRQQLEERLISTERNQTLAVRGKPHTNYFKRRDAIVKSSKGGRNYGSSDQQKRKLKQMFKRIGTDSSESPDSNFSTLTPLVVNPDTERMFLKCKRKIDRRLQNIKHIKPWDMVSRISDELANDVLDEVISELNADDLVKRLFENELLLL